MSARSKPCKDCKAEWERRGIEPPKYPRPAPYPGPRCCSHNRQAKRLAKAGAHEKRVQNVYGLKPGQYWEMYKHQGGKCAICQRATGQTRMLSVDHSHATGLARGLLCRPCNDMIGHGRDAPEFFIRAARYLNMPPARQLGIRAVHEDHRKEE